MDSKKDDAPEGVSEVQKLPLAEGQEGGQAMSRAEDARRDRKAQVTMSGFAVQVTWEDGSAWFVVPSEIHLGEWGARSQEFGEELGFGPTVWEAVRHAIANEGYDGKG